MTPYADYIYDDYELFKEDPYEEIREILAPEYADLNPEDIEEIIWEAVPATFKGETISVLSRPKLRPEPRPEPVEGLVEGRRGGRIEACPEPVEETLAWAKPTIGSSADELYCPGAESLLTQRSRGGEKMETRKVSLAWSVLAIVTLLSLVLAACGPKPTEAPAPPTEAPPSCEYQADKEIVATADDGSKAKIRVDTCIEPPPGGEQVRVESRTPGDWGLTNEQLQKLEKKGKIWSMLDITPDNRTWTPPIIVWFKLKESAPYDDFRLTICQWSEPQQDWRRAGTATAYKKDDQQAKGEITHTSLFALVAEEAETVAVPNVVGRHVDEAREIFFAASLQVGELVGEAAPEQELGAVVWQSLDPGTEVDPGTRVDLGVAVSYEVPYVVGMNMKEAAATLHEAGFELGQIFEEQVSDYEPGTVLQQSPQGGEQVSSGTPVHLVVAIPRTGYALQFDGADDFVSIVDTGRFDFDDAFTLEAWVKPLSLIGRGGFKAIVQGAFSEPPFTGGGWVMALHRSDYSDWALSVCVPGCEAAESGSRGLQIGQWQHLAARYDGAEIVIYRDGKEVGSESHSGNVSDINYVLVGIWSESFSGLIDDVRIWDIARTQSEIQADMYHTLSGNEGGLVGYWRFDEGDGQVVFDSTPYQHNGRLGSSPESDANDPVWVVSDAPID
jgi:hypothetical protein